MAQKTLRTRPRHIRLAAPAAIIGTLAGALTAAPATASETGAISLTSPLIPSLRAMSTASVPDAYTVRSGDSVWAIAQRFGLRTADVLAWNGLSAASTIHPGQVLRLKAQTTSSSAPASPSSTKTHTVVAGDTVYAIAKKYGTTVSAILSANGISGAAIIYPGQKLKLAGSATSSPASSSSSSSSSSNSSTSAKTHTVAKGDTVYAIAKKYGTTTTAVLTANGLSASSIIYPGQKLQLPSTDAALNSKQAENARMIIRIGRELGVSDRGIAIALATSMVESWMRNLDWGDRDSLGLFQQRPSQGWGTAAQIRNRDYSIRVFYGGPSDPNGSTTRGLLDIAGWESMGFSAAAQSVQISQYPERYGQWEKQAYQWLEQYG